MISAELRSEILSKLAEQNDVLYAELGTLDGHQMAPSDLARGFTLYHNLKEKHRYDICASVAIREAFRRGGSDNGE